MRAVGYGVGTVIAHEFGHTLGLIDEYFDSYRPTAPNVMQAYPSRAGLTNEQRQELYLGFDDPQRNRIVTLANVDDLIRYLEVVEDYFYYYSFPVKIPGATFTARQPPDPGLGTIQP